MDDLNYHFDDDPWFIHQENVYFAPDLDGTESDHKNDKLDLLDDKLSDIQVQDYFKDEESSKSDLLSIKIDNFEKVYANRPWNQENRHPNIWKPHSNSSPETRAKQISNENSLSFQKQQSDELMLSKTDPISSFEEPKYACDTSEYYDSNILNLQSQTVHFNPQVHIIKPSNWFVEPPDLDPIQALHHIGYSKGMAWLRAWQKIKTFIYSHDIYLDWK